VPDIAASGRPQENWITGRAGTVLSTPELAELDTYIAKSEYLADLAIECGFQDLAASIKQDLHATKAWRDLIADALTRAKSLREPPAGGARVKCDGISRAVPRA
jgi:hypothetical protein